MSQNRDGVISICTLQPELTYPLPAGTLDSIIFLCPRWDMLVPRRVRVVHSCKHNNGTWTRIEDAFPIEIGDISLLCYFTGEYIIS